jgi:hypothetical protein
VRALGQSGTQPPDVVVTPLTADATVNDLLRCTIAGGVAQNLRHDPAVRLGDDPETSTNRGWGTRRLRSDLSSFAHLLDRSGVAALRSELGCLSTLVGALRYTLHPVGAQYVAARCNRWCANRGRPRPGVRTVKVASRIRSVTTGP